jgi:hypothetical protein
MKRSSPASTHKVFKSVSIQLTAALLTGISEAAFIGFENGLSERNKKVILISYPKSVAPEFKKLLDEFENRTLCVNLFYYNRNLNFLRDRIFNRKLDRKNG